MHDFRPTDGYNVGDESYIDDGKQRGDRHISRFNRNHDYDGQTETIAAVGRTYSIGHFGGIVDLRKNHVGLLSSKICSFA